MSITWNAAPAPASTSAATAATAAVAAVAIPAPPATPAVAAPVAPLPPAVAPARVPLLAQPRVQRVLLPVLVGLVLIGAWQALVVGLELPPYLVPSPALMMQTLITDAGMLGMALLVTLKITVLSFFVATLLGVLISFVFVQSRLIETALFPYAVLLQVTPIVAIAPLIIIWVKDPTASLVLCATLVALFPIISNTTLGLRSVDPDLQAYFKMNRAPRLQTRWISRKLAGAIKRAYCPG